MPPVNDDLANATALSGLSGTVTVDNVGATLESGEWNWQSATGGASVWYRWDLPAGTGVWQVTVGIDATPTGWDGVVDVLMDFGGGFLFPVLMLNSSDLEETTTVSAPITLWIRADGNTPHAETSSGHITYAAVAPPPPPPDPPSISSFTPTQAKVGEPVTITGVNFSLADSVVIGGASAVFTIDSDTQITATVPARAAGAGSDITVSNAGGSDSRAGFTPLHPGPWLISPDGAYEDAAATTVGHDGVFMSDINQSPGSGAPDPASSWSHDIEGHGFWQLREMVFTTPDNSEWLRWLMFGEINLDLFDTSSPGPTPAEEAAPHYVTWEAEADHGTPHFPISVDYSMRIASEGITYYDDIQHKTATPVDIMLGSAQLRRVPAEDYELDSFGVAALVVDDWPSPAAQTGWAVEHEIDLLDSLPNLGLDGTAGYIDNILNALPEPPAGGTPTVTWSTSYDAADLDDERRIALLLTLSRWAAGDTLVEPTMIIPGPEGQTAHGGLKGDSSGGPLVVQANAATTFTYTPPRYRILYDRPLISPPQRQYPRDDGLAISTRRSWPPPTSKQYGMRRGPTATYW